MTRRQARILAMELIFDYEFNRESDVRDRIRLAEENRGVEADDFTRSRVIVAAEHINEIDDEIGACATNWSFTRITVLAKSVMRICIAELLYLGTPEEIAVNEALEIMKMYDDDKARAFVNGVLGGVISVLHGQGRLAACNDDAGREKT